MIYLYIIAWYLIGSVSTTMILKIIGKKVTRGQLIICFTLGSVPGPLMLIPLFATVLSTEDSDWLNKDVF